MQPRSFTLKGNPSLLCAALELAAEKYDADAAIARFDGFERIAEQFEKQAREARELLESAYDARDGEA